MELLNNLSKLNDPNLNLKAVTVLGVRLGDFLERESKESYNNWFDAGKNVKIRIEEDTNKVVEFLFNPEAVIEFKIIKEKDIIKIFGKPEAIELSGGVKRYFYPNRKIVITWNNSRNVLLAIFLGENIIKQTEFRIKDFLEMYYEFKGMVPNYKEWNLNSLRYNEPRYYRLRQLESLLGAFDLGTDLLQDFTNKNFLKRRTIVDFEPIFKDIEKYALQDDFEKNKFKKESERFKSMSWYTMLIQSFMRFSEEMRNILQFNSGWLEAGSITSRYSIYKTQKLLNQIDLTELHEIEYLLCKVLDPKDLVFTKHELISNFNFPDVDLDSIDSDNY